MFESAELGHKIAKAEYDREVPQLRTHLLGLQYDMLTKPDFPVVIVIAGVDGAGKSETLNVLHEWMDPRHIVTTAFGEMSDEEREHPRMWRYWRALPPNGRMGILFGAWHSNPVLDRVAGKTSENELVRACERIVRFERMLVDEGTLLLKFLVPPVEAGAARAAEGAAGGSEDALAHQRHRLGTLQAVRQISRSVGIGAAPHQHRPLALAVSGRQRSLLPLPHRRSHHRRRGAAPAGRRQARHADPGSPAGAAGRRTDGADRPRLPAEAVAQGLPARARQVPGQAEPADAA